MDVKCLQSGAGLYTEMCSGCHLAPGLEKSEISQGLYPRAPELFREPQRSAKEQFWIIKHGVRLPAMPAWGKTHSDELLWESEEHRSELQSLMRISYAVFCLKKNTTTNTADDY